MACPWRTRAPVSTSRMTTLQDWVDESMPAANGIVTATILAVARAAGEAAPVLLTTSAFGQAYQLDPRHAVPTVPLEILDLLNSPGGSSVAQAWGAAFLLMIVILAVNIGARVWLRRSERKRGL